RTAGKWTVKNIAVPCDPSNISGAPVDILIANVENIFRGQVGPEQVSGRRVNDSLRFARRPRRVKNVERMFGVERDRRAVGTRIRHRVVPPDVAAGNHVDPVRGPFYNEHFFDGGTAGNGRATTLGGERLVDIFFE